MAIYLLQLTVTGVILGLIYALISVGLALVFGVLEIINFAHGEILMIGGFAMAFALPAFGLSYWPSLAVAVLVTAAAGYLIYELLLSRFASRDFDRSIIVTLGLSMVLLYGAQYIFSASPRLVDTDFGFEGLEIGDIRLPWTRVVAGGLALCAFAGLFMTLRGTQFGRAMRAVTQNREAALMVGIKPRTVARNAVILACALCGLAGAALAPLQLVLPAMGQAVIFKAFALVVVGGLGSLSGAFVAALLLGLIESFVGGFLDTVWQDTAVFAFMIAAVLVRPDGLFTRTSLRVG